MGWKFRLDIIEVQGGLYSPYDGQCFENRSETDIEHIVARSEAHDSGLCSASPETRAAFATDLLNLTLASPQLNRYEKIAYDVAEWQPEQNLCWYVQRTVEVRRKYSLPTPLSSSRLFADLVMGVLGCAHCR